MDWSARLLATILSTIARDTPKGLWEDFRAGARQTYLDVFHQIDADRSVLPEQRIDKLYQDRHFRMEHLLGSLARNHGLAVTTTPLENQRHFVYATKGAIGLTQSYVPAIGSLPQSARYREQLAAISDIPKTPRLDLGDEPQEVMLGKDFYGVLAHNPIGKRFVEDQQKLGMIQFCVPVSDFSSWAAELSIEEIVSAYASDAPSRRSDRDPEWKRRGEEQKVKKK